MYDAVDKQASSPAAGVAEEDGAGGGAGPEEGARGEGGMEQEGMKEDGCWRVAWGWLWVGMCGLSVKEVPWKGVVPGVELTAAA